MAGRLHNLLLQQDEDGVAFRGVANVQRYRRATRYTKFEPAIHILSRICNSRVGDDYLTEGCSYLQQVIFRRETDVNGHL